MRADIATIQTARRETRQGVESARWALRALRDDAATGTTSQQGDVDLLKGMRGFGLAAEIPLSFKLFGHPGGLPGIVDAVGRPTISSELTPAVRSCSRAPSPRGQP